MSKIETPPELADALEEALDDDVEHLHGSECPWCKAMIVASGAAASADDDDGAYPALCGADDVGVGEGWAYSDDDRVCPTCSEIADELYRRHYAEEHT